MPQRIKSYSDNIYIEYDQGKMDSYCVYFSHPQHGRIAPRDVDYFEALKYFAKKFGPAKVYEDFVSVYDKTGRDLDPEVIDHIGSFSKHYGEDDHFHADVVFNTLYASMIAEERKEKTKLKKRIKRLGVHQLLMENYTPDNAANYSRGKDWRSLDMECHRRGF